MAAIVVNYRIFFCRCLQVSLNPNLVGPKKALTEIELARNKEDKKELRLKNIQEEASLLHETTKNIHSVSKT